MAAIQNTARMFSKSRNMRPTAATGAISAPDRVEPLPQAKCPATHFGRGLVGDDRIAGRTPYAFADAIGEARAHQLQRALRDREQRLGQGGKPVAEQHPWLPPAASIGQPPGGELGEACRRFGDPVDGSQREHRKAKRHSDEDGQERVIDLRAQVHQQADETENPDVAWEFGGRPHSSSLAQSCQRENLC